MNEVVTLEGTSNELEIIDGEQANQLSEESKSLAQELAQRYIASRNGTEQFQIEQSAVITQLTREHTASFSEEKNNLFRKLILEEMREADQQASNSETQQYFNDLQRKSPSKPAAYKLAKKLEYSVSDDENIIAKSRREYVFWFKAQQRKTARASLEMCRTVYEAMKSLSESEFASFCQDIGLDDDSSTIRKYATIGKVYPRLINYADQLPAAWTNIYLLTQIPADDFERCIESGFAFNQLTGSELKALVDRTRDVNNLTSPFRKDKKQMAYPVAKVFFTKLPDDVDFRLLQKALEEVQARLPVKFQMIGAQVKLFKERSEQRYENAKQEDENAPVTPSQWDYGSAANEVYERTNSAA